MDPQTNKYDPKDKFSLINTLEQLKNVNNYHFLKSKLIDNTIKGFALWNDVITSDVYLFSYQDKKFVKVDESSYEKLYKECQVEFQI